MQNNKYIKPTDSEGRVIKGKGRGRKNPDYISPKDKAKIIASRDSINAEVDKAIDQAVEDLN